MKVCPKVLLIGHNASRSGAPIHLLEFGRWLVDQAGWEVSFLLGEEGPLLEDFRAIAPAAVWSPHRSLSLLQRFHYRFLRHVCGVEVASHHQNRIRCKCLRRIPDVIVANTCSVGAIVKTLDLDAPVITTVLELEGAIQAHDSDGMATWLFKRSASLIAVSESVRTNLIENHSCSPGRVRTCHNMAPMPPRPIPCLRKQYGIDADIPVIGGCGSLSYRKGADLFIAVAHNVLERLPEARFVWVGNWISSEDRERWSASAGELGDHLIITGEVENPAAYQIDVDVGLVTSREDPFPLVALEFGHFGVPIVCFADSGGTPELVGSDCGIVVPFCDEEAMASTVVRLVESPQLRRTLGESLANRVHGCFSSASVGRRILAAIKNTLSSANADHQ